MQTQLDQDFLGTGEGQLANDILRKCVHCGFCNATCPTYQLLGDELDGPRGRIYQVKQYLEGAPANDEILKHLDRCLTCRACETTCPSGVDYSQLLEIARPAIEKDLQRPVLERLKRWTILRLINSGAFFKGIISMAQFVARVLPSELQQAIPPRQEITRRRQGKHDRKMLLLAGCVQPVFTPNTNQHAVNILDQVGIEVIELEANLCCGSAAMHTSDMERGLQQARGLIDAWWPYVENGIEAIIVSASGCGVTVKEYGRLLASDEKYAAKARRVSELTRDLVEVIAANSEKMPAGQERARRVAVHTPCTMQHGLGITGCIEQILEKAGYELCQTEEKHLCCGSAGSYSLLQRTISRQLRERKLVALSGDKPDVIVTANVGCQAHLSHGDIPVVHWIELL